MSKVKLTKKGFDVINRGKAISGQAPYRIEWAASAPLLAS
jgi:hypothetical protein